MTSPCQEASAAREQGDGSLRFYPLGWGAHPEGVLPLAWGTAESMSLGLRQWVGLEVTGVFSPWGS